MKTHKLKTIQPYFDNCYTGKKNFEVRFNDRQFVAGDEIELLEYDSITDTYSGRSVKGVISYVLRGFEALKDGYVVFGYYVTEKI